MKIAVFTDAYKPVTSGLTTSLLMLVEGLIEQGHEVTVFTPKAKHYKAYDANRPYIKRFFGFPIPRKGLTIYRFIIFNHRHIKVIKKMNDFDVIHVHTEFSTGKLGLYYKKKMRVPMVYTIHTMYEEYLHFTGKFISKIFKNILLKALKRMMRSFIKASDVVITPSLKIKDLMHRYGIEGNYQIIPTGIDLDNFKQSQFKTHDIETLKASLGIQDQFVCLYVGRVSEEKSIDVLIHEFSKVAKDDMRFVIVGDGPHLKTLMHLVKQLHMTDYIIFTGMINWHEIGLYYQIGDCFLNASTSETQGLTYIEALAAGLPLIVKYDQVLEKVVTHMENGIFYYENNQLSDEIMKLKENPELKDKLASQAVVSSYAYSQKAFIDAILAAYKEAIALNKNK